MKSLKNCSTLKPSEINVTILMGGPSSEYEISIMSGKAVANALRNEGFCIDEIEFKDPLTLNFKDKIDVVFPALHGEYGEDGQIQQLLEDLDIPFVGCDSKASRIIINKFKTKSILQEDNLPIIPGKLIKVQDHPFPTDLELPLIIKPNKGGSTIGLNIINEESEWKSALTDAFNFDDEILVEQYIKGIEITVGILDNKALPVIEIIPSGKIFDFVSKYKTPAKKTQYFCPPKHLHNTKHLELQYLAEKVYKKLNARDMLRVDMIVEIENQYPYILEANSIPGFTSKSLLPKAAAVSGISFNKLCSNLVINTLHRKQ